MPLRFANQRKLETHKGLSELEQAQLERSVIAYFGELPEGGAVIDSGEDEEALAFVSLWQVVDGDTHVLDAWFYNTDSGTFFKAGSTEIVAEIIQFGLECEDDELADRLGPAMVEARLLPSGDSEYDRYAKLLAEQ
ncbi:MAG: hypothetical protein RBU37_01955 [Myxococcota bacterium]|jgi:hypothetical protein|nr:hypothetical protein [Myxococcota bacterium]